MYIETQKNPVINPAECSPQEKCDGGTATVKRKKDVHVL